MSTASTVFCTYGANFVLFVYRKEVFYGLLSLCGISHPLVAGASGTSHASPLRRKVSFSFDH